MGDEHSEALRRGDDERDVERLRRELNEANQTIEALLNSEVDAVVEGSDTPPMLLAEAQDDLREREAWLRAIFERSMDAILVADDGGNYVDGNPAACELFGVSIDELRQLSVHDVAAPGFDSHAAWAQYLEHGEMQGEFVLHRPDGEERVVDFSARARIRPGRHLSILRDVSERNRTQNALRETTELLQQIVDSAPVAITVVDREGIVQSWNPAAEEIFGWKAEEVMGRFSRLRPDGPETVLAEIQAGTSVRDQEIEVQCKDGDPVLASRNAGPLVGPAGENRGAVNIWTDISDRAEIQAQLRQSQKMEAVGRLAGGVSHDFNNMLSAILGFAHLIRDDVASSDPIYDDINQIIRATERAGELTKRLLAFSRQQISHPAVVDLNQLIREFEKMIRRIVGDDIEVEVILSPDVPNVEIDPGQMEQVLMNLAVNARDAMRGGGKLRIRTARSDDDAAMILVEDSGTGMPAEVRERIFEPFFTTKEKGEGTGLGLSTVYGILKQFNGDVDVQSTSGVGTTFIVSLPAADVAVDRGEFSRPPSKSMTRRGNETILVVEDDALVRNLSRQILDRHGYTVLTAANAGEALLAVEQFDGRLDLMLTDVVMPKMSGPQLYERMQTLKPDMRVLFMSGYTADKLEKMRSEGQTVNLLTKPFQPHQLLDSVRATLEAEPG